MIAEKAKENMLATQNNDKASAYQKSDKQVNTSKELAKIAGTDRENDIYQKSDKSSANEKGNNRVGERHNVTDKTQDVNQKSDERKQQNR